MANLHHSNGLSLRPHIFSHIQQNFSGMWIDESDQRLKIKKDDVMIKFNGKIKKNEFESGFFGTGHYWFFNNGQYAERLEIKEQRQISLSYHYGLVFVNISLSNDVGGSRYNSSQRPLSSIRDEKTLMICRDLFNADLESGIIKNNYLFN